MPKVNLDLSLKNIQPIKQTAKARGNYNNQPLNSLGDGVKRLKEAFGCTECIGKDIQNRTRLYATKDGSTVYWTRAELHKTGKVLPESAKYSFQDCDTYAGTAIRVRRSDTCANAKTKPNQVMEIVKAKFFSDAVSGEGVKSDPVKAVTKFKVIKSEEGTPVIEYYGNRKGTKDGDIPFEMKKIKSEDVPKEHTEFFMPDGNIVYYLKDTVRDGKRAVDMRMFEVGFDVPIL